MADETPKHPRKPKGKGKKLTPKQRRLIRNLADGAPTQTAAAIAAGYSPNNARQSAHQALQEIEAKAPGLLDRHGLTDDALISEYVKPMLVATKTEFVKYEGKFSDQREVVAWGPRGVALDMVLHIRGLYKTEQPSEMPNVKVVVINSINRPPRVQRENQS